MEKMQSMQTESKQSRPLTEQEMIDISSLFNMQTIDFKDWSVQIEQVVQTSKQTVDTARDSRADFYIPPQATLLGKWWIEGNMSLINSAGNTIQKPSTVVDNASTSLYITGNLPKSSLSLLQSVYILSGNSSGEELFNISSNAGVVFEQKLQKMKNLQSEFLYYRSDNCWFSGKITGDTSIDQQYDICSGDVGGNNVYANGAKYLSYPFKIMFNDQIERDYVQSRYFDSVGSSFVSNINQDPSINNVCMLSSSVLETKYKYFPLILCQKGITIRLDYDTKSYQGRSFKTLLSKKFVNDTDPQVDITDV